MKPVRPHVSRLAGVLLCGESVTMRRRNTRETRDREDRATSYHQVAHPFRERRDCKKSASGGWPTFRSLPSHSLNDKRPNVKSHANNC
jgi:hypothetical protein